MYVVSKSFSLIYLQFQNLPLKKSLVILSAYFLHAVSTYMKLTSSILLCIMSLSCILKFLVRLIPCTNLAYETSYNLCPLSSPDAFTCVRVVADQ